MRILAELVGAIVIFGILYAGVCSVVAVVQRLKSIKPPKSNRKGKKDEPVDPNN